MTPPAKEKAKGLYSKFYNRIEHTLSEEYSQYEVDVVKECAKIATNNTIDTLKEILEKENLSSFWYIEQAILEQTEVNIEIEKL